MVLALADPAAHNSDTKAEALLVSVLASPHVSASDDGPNGAVARASSDHSNHFKITVAVHG
jgi:hypothetical protein